MSGETQLSGPDLAQGIDAADVRDGGTLLGHTHGEAVLLARRGSDVFAIGATCTHYSGPLAEGLIVGDEVRCPWHHACFSLRTGEAVSAPALNPVACWKVERSAERLIVREKLVMRASAVASVDPGPVVIVGGGAAGHAAAEMLRRVGYGGAITLLSGDVAAPVDRPNLSKDYLAGTAPEEWMPLRPPEFFAEQNIHLELGARARSVDAKARTVTLDSGRTVAYRTLLLATGADPIRLTMPGSDLPHVHTLRTIGDSRAIIARALHGERAVVIGASFIGLEVAAALTARGMKVHVVGLETRPLERALGPALGDLVRSVHEAHGVVFHLGDTVTSVSAKSIVLEKGGELAADLVVMGVGVKPSTALAQSAGCALDRGVLVNEYMETSVPGIYAAGDIARWPDARTGEKTRVEHWVVAQRLGQCAARNIAGVREKFEHVPFFWSNHFDLGISYVGHAEKWDRIDVAGDITARDAALAYRANGRTLAVATVGRDHASLEAEVAIARGDEAALRALVPPA